MVSGNVLTIRNRLSGLRFSVEFVAMAEPGEKVA